MTLGYDGRLYILAFDHRGSFQKKMFGIEGDPSPEQTETISDAKHLIFEGMLKAVEAGVDPGVTGVLVDEQFGAPKGIPSQARERGLLLAMPVEKSGQNDFDFEYGDDFGAHIEQFDPNFSKVLVRYNPDGDADMNAEQTDTIADAKHLIFEGLLKATEQGVDPHATGCLVDEQFGAPKGIPSQAKENGLLLAMPVEKSGQNDFDFEYGDDFGAHIEKFDPDFSKVLVRYNPEGDAEMNRVQAERLKRLADWLHEHDRKFLFELLVPAEDAQLEQVGGDSDRYDAELRPELMRRAIVDLQDAGVEADIWKIEGIDTQEDCDRIARTARRDGRDGVICVVLGRGADDAKVDHWLRQGAPVEGYAGFAIGRTIWWDALKGFLDGNLERDAAAQQVADNYLRFVQLYDEASKQAAHA